MRKSSDGRPAMVFDHARAAEKGMYANRAVYAVEGVPGVFRRLSGHAAAEITQKGGTVVRAVFDGGIIHLAPWRLFMNELAEAGMVTPEIANGLLAVNAVILKAICETTHAPAASPAPDPAPPAAPASSSDGQTSSQGQASSHPAEGVRSEPVPDGAGRGHRRTRVATAP